MLPVSLDCPFLIVPLVFSSAYYLQPENIINKEIKEDCNKPPCLMKNLERHEKLELMVIFLILVLSNNWCLDDNFDTEIVLDTTK
jgi:hypothetical protein